MTTKEKKTEEVGLPPVSLPAGSYDVLELQARLDKAKTEEAQQAAVAAANATELPGSGAIMPGMKIKKIDGASVYVGIPGDAKALPEDPVSDDNSKGVE